MSRSLLAGMSAALAGDNLTALLFIQLDFDSGSVYVTNLGHDISWNGQSWIGAGHVGSVDAIVEGDSGSATGMAFTLTGIPPALVAVSMTEQYQGRRARVWFGAIAAGALVSDPVLVWSGRMDNMMVALGSTASIRVNAESRLTDFERARVRRYNHEDQIASYPTDRGFEYVPQMVEKSLYWGVANPPAPSA